MKKSGVMGQEISRTLRLALLMLLAVHCPLSVPAVHAGEERQFSLEFRDTELRDVLKALAQESGKNVIVPDTVTGKVTLSLDKISLSDALDVILKSHGLGYVTEKGVVRVIRLSEAELAGEELVTEVIIANYAKASDLINQIKGVLSARGTISVDSRTNSFIVKDIRKGIEDAKMLIERLDPRTRQVLIEARIVEASSNFSRSLGVQWGTRYVADAAHGNPGGVYFPNSFSINGGGAAAPGGTNYAVNLPAANPTGSLGITMGSITNDLLLDVQLSAAEKTGEVKIISTPKVTTVNNKPATVSSGIEYNVKTTTTAGGTQTTSGTTSVSAKTSLTVTPQISADNHILLTIDSSRDEPDFSRQVDGIPGIIRKAANTTVLVKDGETTVIGGLYRNAKGATNTSVPFFSKIPVIGWLFRSKDRVEENEELLIFITPRILKEQIAEEIH